MRWAGDEMEPDLVPQLCAQCIREGASREPKPIVKQFDGWGKEGDMTLYELSCGHRFLLHTPERNR